MIYQLIVVFFRDVYEPGLYGRDCANNFADTANGCHYVIEILILVIINIILVIGLLVTDM